MRKSSKCYLAVGALTAAIFTLPSGLAGADEQRSDAPSAPDRAELIVVRNSAQWCKVCTSTRATFAELKNQLNAEPVLFVTLDQTDTASKQQALYLAQALGIHDQIADSMGRVGTIMIVDAQSKKLISKSALSPDVEVMVQTIKKARSTAS